MDKAPRIGVLPQDAQEEKYTFKFCDLDFNRHVNTVRYIDLILDFWSLAHYDAHTVARIDLYFHKECHYGEEITLRVAGDAPDANVCEIVQPDGSRAITARLVWQKI